MDSVTTVCQASLVLGAEGSLLSWGRWQADALGRSLLSHCPWKASSGSRTEGPVPRHRPLPSLFHAPKHLPLIFNTFSGLGTGRATPGGPKHCDPKLLL